jgi:hypothetical protein
MVEPVKATPREQTPDEKKTLKKLLDAHVEVLEHKLGRSPSMEELSGMLSETPAEGENSPTPTAQDEPHPGEHQQNTGVSPDLDKTDAMDQSEMEDRPCVDKPKILYVKAYYGMTDPKEGEERQPDPNKILYYENPLDNQCYDCARKEWLSERPEVLDHLNSRELGPDERDIVSAIAHGIMDDDDYAALDEKGMIGEIPKRLWDLTKKLEVKVEELEKSTEVTERENSTSEEPVDPDFLPSGNNPEQSGGDNVLSKYFDAANVQFSEDEMAALEQMGAPTVDHIATIMKIATAKAMTGMEAQIRAIVKEELETMLDAYGSPPEEEEAMVPNEPETLDTEENVE